MRRVICTLCEFAEGLRLLTDLDEFKAVTDQFDNDIKARWEAAISYFNTHESFIKNVRNDVGGHFGSGATIYAIENLLPNVLGKIEFTPDLPMKMHPIKLHFAHEIALTAYLKHPPGNTLEDRMDFLVKKICEGFPHASTCVEILVGKYLWPRFGR
jgi:hypothetical protein